MSFARRLTTLGVTLAMIGGIAPLAFGAHHLVWERNVKVVKKFYDGIFKGDLSELAALVAEDFVDHDKMEGMPEGVEGLIATMTMFRTAFPDGRIEAKRLIAEGDYVATFGVADGTNTGEMMGMPATGNKVKMVVIDIMRLEDEKVAEVWTSTDDLSMMMQLGVIPAMGAVPDYEAMAEALAKDGMEGGSVEANKAVAKRVMDDVWAGNLDAIGEIYAADYVSHSMTMPGMDPLDVLRMNVQGWKDSFSDTDRGNVVLVGAGDLVATRWWASGTHTGEFMGSTPTNKKVTIKGNSIYRIHDGKIVEEWTIADMMGFMQQLGLIPGM
ncbi:MAG: ester cyclase [Candidatus Poribacteria bacterium]|nr:ester cyclase [Candidatus Poribacteria bacterium]